MKTPSAMNRPILLLGLAALLTLAACAGGAASTATSSPPSASPSAPASVPGGGGSSDGPDTGVGAPVDPSPLDPGAGQPALVIPKPGQLNPRPLPAETLEASVDGRRVLVKATWWSGVEPCYVLDSVDVKRSDNDIAITLIEGSSDLNAACIEIAMQKATIVDLGELEPGTYTISSPGGDAVPVTVTVS